MRMSSKKFKFLAIFTLIFAVLIVPATRYGWLKMTEEVKTVTVTDKERVQDPNNNGSRYLVFTTETTYEMTDTWFWWRFNTSDEYGRIQKGQKYKITTVGLRLGFLSWYPNIVKYQRIEN